MRSIVLITVLAVAITAALPAAATPAPPAGLPHLTSLFAEPFTPAERKAVVAWTMARPEVVERLAGHRNRLLRVGADSPKTDDGSEYRRATLIIRDYDLGTTLQVTVSLSTGDLRLTDISGFVQPNEEEIAEAKAIIVSDELLSSLIEDPRLTLMGGFYNLSPFADDPCSHDVCLEFAFMKPSFEKEAARRVIVDLTRRVVSSHDFQGNPDGNTPARMTEPEGGSR